MLTVYFNIHGGIMSDNFSNTLKTTDYDMFSFNEANRPLIKQHVDKLKKAIQERSLLEINPIIVNKQLQVMDGQHRLEAAKQLGVEVFYIITEEDDVMQTLNINSRKWSTKDFLRYHATKKTNNDYVFLWEVCQRYEDMESFIMYLLMRGGFGWEKFKDGRFTLSIERDDILPLIDFASKISGMLEQHPEKGVKLGAKTVRCAIGVKRLFYLIRKNNKTTEEFLKRIETRIFFMPQCHKEREYVEAFLFLYNSNLAGKNKIVTHKEV